MSLINTPEFFINQKSIPDKNSVEYDAFFLAELEKIKYGVTVNGVYIHGWLYFHINHWNILMDIVDPINGDIIRKFGKPDFRDNEWIIADHITRAEKEKKGLMIFGSRRLGKSVCESSWTGRGATIYQGSENIISSTNSSDLLIVTSLIDKGLNGLHPYFKHTRINDNWSKEVTFGFKEKSSGERHEWSKIAIRNLSAGNNTEAFAGLTPKTLIIDEIGKADFGEAFKSAVPAFTSPYGWRCMPILTGTGGTLGHNTDAEKYFTNPISNNFLAVTIPNKKKQYGLFISGLHRMEGKVEDKFGNYIQRASGIIIPEDSELNTLHFSRTDETLARSVIQGELELALKDNDPKAYLKQRMYFPEDPDDCFLTDDGNKFPIDGMKDHLTYIETKGDFGEAVELFRKANGAIDWKVARDGLKQIQDFPVTKTTIKDAPVMIYEHPMDNPPVGLYIAGADPYNQAESDTSESLGTVYIYKRMYDPATGVFQDTMVASLASRPSTMKEWHETLEMLLEYYNAICMPENEGGTLIQYFDNKNKSHMLADGYSFLKQITPNTTIKGRQKGLPATVGVKKYCMNLFYDYCKEEIQVGTNEDGTPIMKMGYVRIKDPMLLRECIGYRSKDGNYDRIVAFYHVLACNVSFNILYPVIKFREPESDKKEQKTIHSPFIMTQANPFSRYRVK